MRHKDIDATEVLKNPHVKQKIIYHFYKPSVYSTRVLS